MEEAKNIPLVEMKALSVKLEDLVAIMTEITLRLGQIKQTQFEADAREIRDRITHLSQQLKTTTTDPNG